MVKKNTKIFLSISFLLMPIALGSSVPRPLKGPAGQGEVVATKKPKPSLTIDTQVPVRADAPGVRGEVPVERQTLEGQLSAQEWLAHSETTAFQPQRDPAATGIGLEGQGRVSEVLTVEAYRQRLEGKQKMRSEEAARLEAAAMASQQALAAHGKHLFGLGTRDLAAENRALAEARDKQTLLEQALANRESTAVRATAASEALAAYKKLGFFGKTRSNLIAVANKELSVNDLFKGKTALKSKLTQAQEAQKKAEASVVEAFEKQAAARQSSNAINEQHATIARAESLARSLGDQARADHQAYQQSSEQLTKAALKLRDLPTALAAKQRKESLRTQYELQQKELVRATEQVKAARAKSDPAASKKQAEYAAIETRLERLQPAIDHANQQISLLGRSVDGLFSYFNSGGLRTPELSQRLAHEQTLLQQWTHFRGATSGEVQALVHRKDALSTELDGKVIDPVVEAMQAEQAALGALQRTSDQLVFKQYKINPALAR